MYDILADVRYLIVNADDFGLSDGVNRGIIEAIERGIVTSASLMVRQAGAESAAKYAQHERRFSTGLHLDLGEWVFRGGEWEQLYSVVSTQDRDAVSQEAERQLAEFQRLVGRNPSHLDSHQHVHRDEPVRTAALKIARELNIPVRQITPGIRYCGDFYGQGNEGEPFHEALSVTNLKRILSEVQPGVTELACHPGYVDGLASVYAAERELELQTLCSPSVRPALEGFGIQLCTFEQAPQLLGGAAGQPTGPALSSQH